VLERRAFAHVGGERTVTIDTDAHTFAREGDLVGVADEVLALLRRVEIDA
jgi:hypothetical protein